MMSILVLLELGTGIGVAVKRMEIEEVMDCKTNAHNTNIGCLNNPHLAIGCDGAILFVFSFVQVEKFFFCFNNFYSLILLIIFSHRLFTGA